MSYPVERLWNPFLGESCKTLVNKPKLFFIQACRGENLEKAVEFTSFSVMTRDLGPPVAPEPQIVTYAIPSTADMVVFYSTFDSKLFIYNFFSTQFTSKHFLLKKSLKLNIAKKIFLVFCRIFLVSKCG